MKFYTIKEISEETKLSERTIEREIAVGRLIATRLGNQWRI